MATHETDWRAGFANLALGVGGVASVVSLLLSLQFFGVERGQHIRPMGWAVVVFLIAKGAFLVGLPSGIVGCFSSRRWIAVIGICLSFAPYPLAIITLILAVKVRGLVISS